MIDIHSILLVCWSICSLCLIVRLSAVIISSVLYGMENTSVGCPHWQAHEGSHHAILHSVFTQLTLLSPSR
ncbi:hypothetical protein BDP55DRAFT_665608 [Colletotrichum godetiae]|uniref:Uncharacterized protein n=1 Tax=Colletotrichum godetiae TaxID=1209918 RepID=A0AAJ0AMA4_9PEZI|nr:uncharacterized protein BDP55DRAFT_665608 [Colletotrichum godetiae]KAK1675028.1 hypothetical protein BDP55DRAFT_665608 [Colletotrichum godetiae]